MWEAGFVVSHFLLFVFTFSLLSFCWVENWAKIKGIVQSLPTQSNLTKEPR